ncbi:MAG: bifunctional methionine sulfoxide reductase B/A protein [Phycisphaerales bacterium]|nr:bifunctional methionine sulfoxide reductase B/A protein [Phycisphaerales bacterium]
MNTTATVVLAGVGALLGLLATQAWVAARHPGRSGGSPIATALSQPEDHPNVTHTHKYSKSGYDVTPLPRGQVEELASKLSPEAYKVTQKAGTEAPFCGNLLDNHKDGVYCCVVCGLPLFSSEAKFTSGTGWPSFFTTFDRDHVVGRPDTSLGMSRTEIECARCDAHLGHVFEDGPEPTGLRFCLNSASLVFYEQGQERPAASLPVPTETAYFAGGCFWGIEHYFDLGDGVIEAESGFMQGHVEKPSYEQVCDHNTGHAETVRVVFDPKVITYERLLQAFFDMHDPTQVNRQGPDVGDQYRSGIWYASDAQKSAAEAYIKKLTEQHKYTRPIATAVEAAKTFYPAEDYHQDYIARTGRMCYVKNPW